MATNESGLLADDEEDEEDKNSFPWGAAFRKRKKKRERARLRRAREEKERLLRETERKLLEKWEAEKEVENE